jgi:hypothetical protein
MNPEDPLNLEQECPHCGKKIVFCRYCEQFVEREFAEQYQQAGEMVWICDGCRDASMEDEE